MPFYVLSFHKMAFLGWNYHSSMELYNQPNDFGEAFEAFRKFRTVSRNLSLSKASVNPLTEVSCCWITAALCWYSSWPQDSSVNSCAICQIGWLAYLDIPDSQVYPLPVYETTRLAYLNIGIRIPETRIPGYRLPVYETTRLAYLDIGIRYADDELLSHLHIGTPRLQSAAVTGWKIDKSMKIVVCLVRRWSIFWYQLEPYGYRQQHDWRNFLFLKIREWQ